MESRVAACATSIRRVQAYRLSRVLAQACRLSKGSPGCSCSAWCWHGVSVPGAQQAAVARRLHGLVLDTRADGSFELPRAGRVPDGTIPHESTSCETGRASSSCYEELTLSVPSVATSISAVAKGCRSGCKARTVQPWPVWCHSPHAFSLAQHSWTQSSWLYCSWVRRVARCRQ